MKVDAAAVTDIGLVRDHNEDAFLSEPPLFVVADGMGGHLGGEVASAIAIETLREGFGKRGPEGVANSVHQANEAILRRSQADAAVEGMGTTITAAVLTGSNLHIVHVGDSRAYLRREGELLLVTSDHTLVGEMVREGTLSDDQARVHPRRSILVRALGIDTDVEIDLIDLPLQEGDRLLLCSDGLNSMITDQMISELCAPEYTPEEACTRLVEAANQAGGTDNITVIVADFAEGSEEASELTEATDAPAEGEEGRGFMDRLLRRKT